MCDIAIARIFHNFKCRLYESCVPGSILQILYLYFLAHSSKFGRNRDAKPSKTRCLARGAALPAPAKSTAACPRRTWPLARLDRPFIAAGVHATVAVLARRAERL